LYTQIIFLQDWYIETGMQQFDGLNSYPFVWVGNPNSLLINGKGIAPECQVGGINYNNSIFCLPKCMNDPLSLLSSINVTTGTTYRFRIINSGQLIMTNFAISGHNLTIVQADGTNVEPYTVSSIDITPGQRYDVLLVANKVSGSYLIRTVGRGRDIGTINGTAILNYDGDNMTLPNVFYAEPIHPKWNDTDFGTSQDLELKTLNASDHPTYSALSATEVTRIVTVGTQNGKLCIVINPLLLSVPSMLH
jgi:FtsP/CotA-like multicopper oxidase with cupredoxin domain